jgi:sn-glycerol 3-phosphate transport system permease protein
MDAGVINNRIKVETEHTEQGVSWKEIIKKGLPYLMIAPTMAVSLVFLVYPILYMIKLGFYKWNMVGEMKFIGLDNYRALMTDPEFLQVLKNTCQFSFWTVAGCMILGMMFALYLNKNARFERLVQVIMFTPYVLPMISIAFIWMWIMDGDIGLINYILGFFGIEKVRWLDDPDVAMYSLILVNIWKGVGYYTLIILSALQSIPKYIYEAAELDQAHPVTTFFRLTLPMLSPTLFFLSITAVISSFKVFETVNVMTAGGPQNSTTSLVYYIYQYGFQFYKIGYASAAGVILMVIVGAFTLVYFGCLQKKVHYQ